MPRGMGSSPGSPAEFVVLCSWMKDVLVTDLPVPFSTEENKQELGWTNFTFHAGYAHPTAPPPLPHPTTPKKTNKK